MPPTTSAELGLRLLSFLFSSGFCGAACGERRAGACISAGGALRP